MADSSTPITQSFYWSGDPGAATSGLVLAPDYQNKGTKASLQDVQNHITQYSASQDPWSQNYVKSLRAGLSQINVGAPSGYVKNETTGNLDTQAHVDQQSKDTAALASGASKNVGTAQAPLLVPTGSAADQALQQNPAGAKLNTDTPYTPENGQAYDRFQQAANAAKAAGTTSPSDATGANTMYNQFLPPQQQSNPMDNFVSQDPMLNTMVADYQKYMSQQNQQTSLADTYQQMLKDTGIQGIDTQLLDMKKVMDGSEDDIRKEITSAGGMATESQVQALTNARNKTLIQNYNNLLATRDSKQKYLDTVMNLTEKDRAAANQQFDTRMNFDAKIADYAQKMHTNALDSFNNTIKAIGYGGLVQTLTPAEASIFEKTYGLPAGGLAIAAQGEAIQRYTDNQKIYAKYAMDAGQSNIAAKITALDPKSPTFVTDLAKLQGLIGTKLTTAQLNAGLKQVPTTTTSAGSAGQTATTTGTIHNDVQAILEGRNTMYNIRQTMGRTNAAAAYMAKVRDQITAIDPNFDFVASDAGGKSVSTAYVQRATASINSVLPNIDIITKLSDQVERVGVKGVDATLQSAALQIGNAKISNFRQAQKLIADEIGVALGAGTVSDMKLQLGYDITDPTVKPEVFASNMNLVKQFLTNRLAGLNSLRYSSSTVNSTVPKQEDINYSLSQIGVKPGIDGFVNPEGWTAIKNAWKGDQASLESIFGHLKNPNNHNYK